MTRGNKLAIVPNLYIKKLSTKSMSRQNIKWRQTDLHFRWCAFHASWWTNILMPNILKVHQRFLIPYIAWQSLQLQYMLEHYSTCKVHPRTKGFKQYGILPQSLVTKQHTFLVQFDLATSRSKRRLIPATVCSKARRIFTGTQWYASFDPRLISNTASHESSWKLHNFPFAQKLWYSSSCCS